MKKIVIILLSALIATSIKAQMDEKFYFPDKDWIGIDSSLAYKEIILHSDNDTIYSLLFTPATSPKATILYLHGNGSNISKWTGHIKPLIEDGFQVCILDYRGYGKSTGTPTHLNIVQDAQALLDTLFTLDEVGNGKMILYGASIGTQAAVKITKDNNDRISALVLDGMMTSFTDVALLTSPVEYHDMIRQYVKSPYSAREDIVAIKDICILFIHSEEDAIPIAGAQEIYNLTSCDKIFWKYEGAHIEAPVKYPLEFVEYINKLL